MTNQPKIGIRPIIDGRWGGVREGLEQKTMNMARSAAELISSQVRYPDGTPIQCIVADQTIGGGEEAARCAAKFSSENVCATLSVTPCWCYGSETMDLDPLTVKAVWGSTVQNAQEPYTWPPLWRRMPSADFLLFRFMDMTCRTLPIMISPQMYRRKF